ncbi:uncharacterized protein LACBIDRAFT_293894 [Laccaria bicolor S238N-H82]|uniref:Predicted protein n=1 Tax=Laccaria bicolor (strain S238N-H82 / ATCC MYA-4686) TaxID=486041 RepID=B0D7J2_LACBS|nr:uncharacterized protein LACBIDRAFT_293894 [Laccaria bicolor S238N-H82]EDR09406.1 predicted protein [Laccaria bicolor S238N-H82]|eukprot:XP_001879755.1 predicted protein [Laccaria bicolor S238N-H82]
MSLSISLSPTPGFCVKSKALTPVATKVFINIAWDKNVPSPPKSSEEDIQRAMSGDGNERGNPWYVPVVVSEPRQDVDKAGNQALVFDCVYNSTLRSRSVRDPDFKSFLVELAIQRIEAQSNIPLSRQIATPNIASKGKLLPRTVNIPSTLLKEDPISKKPLIQELPTDDHAKPNPKGILKRSSPRPNSLPLEWSWSRLDSGTLNIVFRVPNMTHTLIPKTTLDVEPRRIILAIPSHPVLDIDLNISDAEITSRIHNSEIRDKTEDTTRTLLLKRQRDFDVDNTKAEWRVAEGVLIVSV